MNKPETESQGYRGFENSTDEEDCAHDRPAKTLVFARGELRR